MVDGGRPITYSRYESELWFLSGRTGYQSQVHYQNTKRSSQESMDGWIFFPEQQKCLPKFKAVRTPQNQTWAEPVLICSSGMQLEASPSVVLDVCLTYGVQTTHYQGLVLWQLSPVPKNPPSNSPGGELCPHQ